MVVLRSLSCRETKLENIFTQLYKKGRITGSILMTREKGEQNGRKARRFSFFAASCGYVALSSLELKNSQFSVSFSLLGRENPKPKQEMKRRKKENERENWNSAQLGQLLLQPLELEL